jgi:flagellar biosynthesis protein FlhA
VGQDFAKQLFSDPQPLMLASGVLVVLGLFPGLPTIPFIAMGSGMGYVSWNMRKKIVAIEKAESMAKPAAAKENLESLLKVEPLTVEMGLGLVKYVGGREESPLLKRIAGIRRQLAGDIGFLLGPVRVVDNISLKAHEYVVLLKGAEIGRYELPPGCELAIPVGKPEPLPGGKATKEPAFGMAGWWIPADQADAARRKGFTVIDPVSVMGTHLSELIRTHAHELLSRQDAKRFLDRVGVEHPKVVEDLVPKLLPLSAVQRVLQNLLRERVSIRDSLTIVEALGEAAVTIHNPILITEYVRQCLRRIVVKPYLKATGELPAFLLSPTIEQLVEGAVEHGDQNSHLTLAPQAIRDILQRITQRTGRPEAGTVVVTSTGARHFLKQMTEHSIRNLIFISHNEIPADIKIISLGVIE